MRRSFFVPTIAFAVGLSVVSMAKGDSASEWMGAHKTSDEYLRHEEILGLPRYCQLRLTVRDARRKGREVPQDVRQELSKWNSLLGSGASGFHHYCWGIGMMQRAASHFDLETNDDIAQARKARYLNGAVGAFNYMLRSIEAYPTMAPFPFMPELHFYRGLANHRLRNVQEAIQDFIKAIGAQKNYTEAYAGLAEALIEVGEYRQAREVLSLGTQKAANPEPLRKMLESMDD
jgi:tetratricopeptide (TPR) repeat protein